MTYFGGSRATTHVQILGFHEREVFSEGGPRSHARASGTNLIATLYKRLNCEPPSSKLIRHRRPFNVDMFAPFHHPKQSRRIFRLRNLGERATTQLPKIAKFV